MTVRCYCLHNMLLSVRIRYIRYPNLLNIRPWLMNLKWYLKEGVGIFSRVVIFLSTIRPPHTVSLALVICTCSDSVMPLLLCACLCNNSKWCLPSFVSPSSCTVLLLHCFLLNIRASNAAQLGGHTFKCN